MLRAIGFIALVYLALQLLGAAVFAPDWPGISHGLGQALHWEGNPLLQLAGGLVGLLMGAVAIVLVIGLVGLTLVMAAGLPLLLLMGLLVLLLAPALLPLAILAGLFLLALGGLGCLFA